jgi:hypothetical protein
VIDLSIVMVTWNTRELALDCLESIERKDPALRRIEYHRPLYRFFRKNRGRGRMAIVFVLRIAKSLFYVVSQAPLAMLGERQRARWVVHRDVLLWHLRGCPASLGLARVSHHAHLRTLTRDFGVRLLDVPTGTPPVPNPEISRQSTNLHALATRRGERSGLARAVQAEARR